MRTNFIFLNRPDTVGQLLDHILKEPKCETSIVGGITVLLTLLECDNKETNEILCNPYGSLAPAEETPTPEATEPSKVVTNTIQAILPRLKDFHDVLINPPVVISSLNYLKGLKVRSNIFFLFWYFAETLGDDYHRFVRSTIRQHKS